MFLLWLSNFLFNILIIFFLLFWLILSNELRIILISSRTLNLNIHLSKTDIFIKANLPIQEHCMAFYLLQAFMSPVKFCCCFYCFLSFTRFFLSSLLQNVYFCCNCELDNYLLYFVTHYCWHVRELVIYMY